MSDKFRNKYKITSTRLQGYDYSSEGAYFITICTHQHQNYFGDIINGEINLSEIGKIIEEEWFKTEEMRDNVYLGEYCTMPNHIHGIIFMGNPIIPEKNNQIPQTEGYRNLFGGQKTGISTIINGFKSACTSQIWNLGDKTFDWQVNYHDHIIRNQKRFTTIENYIRNNSRNWEDDKFYKK